MSQGVIQGTVPYLGTFLTDLVMLDTAMKDYLYVSEPWGPGQGGSRAGVLEPQGEALPLSPELSALGIPHRYHMPGHLPASPMCEEVGARLVRPRATGGFGPAPHSPPSGRGPRPPGSGTVWPSWAFLPQASVSPPLVRVGQEVP